MVPGRHFEAFHQRREASCACARAMIRCSFLFAAATQSPHIVVDGLGQNHAATAQISSGAKVTGPKLATLKEQIDGASGDPSKLALRFFEAHQWRAGGLCFQR